MINEWQIGRDPKLYEQPKDFEPERFLNSEIDYKENDFQLIPFGAGRRFVLESNLPWLSMRLPWQISCTSLTRRCLVNMTESTGLTTHKKDPLRAVAIPLNETSNFLQLVLCPGIQFAISVTEIASANIVHKFNWALPGGASGEGLDMTECSVSFQSCSYSIFIIVYGIS
ncbi:hypothetical protein DVH24_039705 [Malus domestica]|uniref:Cytochrome P450 n=1 Tax=Malus domestica TaxID=3750 RepID=A0A498I6C8_MALDO|nr:hypothetical protein DVH24_039705 [Malus domestica]